MKISLILKAKGAEVATIRADATIAAAAQVLKERGIGALVVSEDGNTIQGLLTERDIVLGLAEHGGRLPGMRVVQLMNASPVTCTPDDTIQHAMAQMTRYRVRQIPVVEDARLRGIVSIGDVVKHRLDEVELEANVLRDAFLARR